MKATDWFAVLSALGIGFLSGVFLYWTGFRPVYFSDAPGRIDDFIPAIQDIDFSGGPDGGSDTAAVARDEFTIVGTAYGGCAFGGVCPSFRLKSDGALQVFDSEGTFTDTLKDEDLENIIAAIERANLSSASQSVERNDCTSFVDGVDVRYEVAFASGVVTLDSCRTNFSERSPLGQALGVVWEY